MNKKEYIIVSLASVSVLALTSCNLFKKKKGDDNVDFDFSISLHSTKTTLEVEDTDQVDINSNKPNEEVERKYTFSVSDDEVLSISDTGYVVALAEGAAVITVKEEVSSLERTLVLNVEDKTTLANGGFNFSSATGDAAVKQRTEILGKLEKYAVDKHLTGITLFENGGYVKYNTRLKIPASEYITGYGFGILSEGEILSDLAKEDVAAYKRYYHSAQTNDPGTINAWDDTGSQVSDLSSYITSSYWGTKMNSTKDGYDWYPVLAADKLKHSLTDNLRPIPVYDVENPLGLYNTWKIYVKTGADGLKYRHSGIYSGTFDDRLVQLKDYAFVYQILLTGVNGQTRGAEMAGDKTYGIKGAQAFYNRTNVEGISQDDIDNIWKTMTKSDPSTGYSDPATFHDQQLGILINEDAEGTYIQLEILKEIDPFTAMYTLSSNLVSPIPRDFIKAIADEKGVGTHLKEGVAYYGINSQDNTKSIVDHSISLGAYKLDVWNNEYIAFGRNDTWVERTTYPNRYKIAGVKITDYPSFSTEKLYETFNEGYLDSTGIPDKYLNDEIGQPGVKRTKGDSTFKLNINSCTRERWNELNTKLWKNSESDRWDVKPWMSNQNFLNGLYWAIDRETFAKNRGYSPSIDYFSNAYLSNPEKGISYNETEEHKEAVKKWHTIKPDGTDDYGFNKDKAIDYFKKAVLELQQTGDIIAGTPTNPKEIHIHIRWMYQTDIQEYGNEIKGYLESAFNDSKVCGNTVKLVVDQDAVTVWNDVYEKWMMKGRFDLAFGAISGNTYSPLNFLEVLRSDNSSGFTLNWGPDTNAVDSVDPLRYDGHKWSFDSLWEAADRGAVVENGKSVKICKNYHLDGFAKKISDGTSSNNYCVIGGVRQSVNLEFVDLDGVEISDIKVYVYVNGGDMYKLPCTYDSSTKKLSITISQADGETIRDAISAIVNKNKSPGDSGYVDPATLFTRDNYGTYWSFESYYNLSISGGTPSEQYISIVKQQSDQN